MIDVSIENNFWQLFWKSWKFWKLRKRKSNNRKTSALEKKSEGIPRVLHYVYTEPLRIVLRCNQVGSTEATTFKRSG